MMRWVSVLPVLLALLAGPVRAQDARVRTGEHRDFTRMVVMLPAPGTWHLQQTETGYALSLPHSRVQFDLSQAFTRINRKRVRTLQAEPGLLTINEGSPCDCRAEAFEFRPGIVVIDLRDGKPEGQPALPPAGPSAPAALLATTGRTPDGPPLPQVSRAEMLLRMTRSIVAETDLSLAARAQDAPPGTDPRPQEADPCAPDIDLDLAGWLPAGQQAAAALSSARARLFDARDALDPEAAITLAQAYLAAGFGAEAAQTLDLAGPELAKAALYRAIAQLIDSPGGNSPLLTGRETCDSGIALWAVLARDHLRPAEPISATGVVMAFLQLPPDLKPALFPAVVARLSEAGYLAEVTRLRNDMDRLLAQRTPDHPADGSAALLAPEASLRTPQEAADVAGNALQRLARGEVLPPDAITNMEAILNQTGRTADRTMLTRAIALAHAGAGGFDAAFALATADPKLREEVIAVLARQGSDNDLLLYIRRSDASADPEAETATRLARRFRSLGFTDEARFWEAVVPRKQPFGPPRQNLAAPVPHPASAPSGADQPASPVAVPGPVALAPGAPLGSLADARRLAEKSEQLASSLYRPAPP